MSGCARNMIPASEDLGAPFKVQYRPCGRTTELVDVHITTQRKCTMMCRVHAAEAEDEGAIVDWPEVER